MAFRQRHLWLLILAVLVGGAFSGCANDGRTLAEPQTWQTTTTRPLPPTSALPEEVSPTGLAITSSDFEPGGPAPVDALCTGANIHPNLELANIPDNAVELAITLSDQTDPENPLLHWLVAGIRPTETRINAGELPVGAFQTLNDYGNGSYGQPCIEQATPGNRDFQFRVYALETPSGLAPGGAGNEAWDTLRALATDTASVMMRIETP